MSLLLLFGYKEPSLEASVAATSSVTGSLTATRALAGSATGAATAGATLNATVALAGVAAGVSATSAELLAVRLLEGTVSGSSSCTGDMNALVLLEGTFAGQSGITGSLRYSGLSLSDVYLEVTGTPVFNNDADPADNYLGSWTLPCTVRSGGKADCILETGMAAVKWGHHNQVGETKAYTGGLLMTSDLNTAPYLDVFTVDSGNSPYPWETSAITPRVRLGNLNGVGGLSSDEWGIALGYDLSDNTSAAKSLIASDQRFAMRNIDISLYETGKQTVSIGASGDIKIGSDISAAATTALDFDAGTGALIVKGDITVNSGSFAGVVSIGTDGGLYQGSGTFASPTTGLKVWNDGGIGRLSTYKEGTAQVYFDTSGALWAATGDLKMSAAGFTVSSHTSPTPTAATSILLKSDWAGGHGEATYNAGRLFAYVYQSGISLHSVFWMDSGYSSDTAKKYPAIEIHDGDINAFLKFYGAASAYCTVDSGGAFSSTASLTAGTGLSSGATPNVKASGGLAGHVEAHGASDTVGVFYGLNRTYLSANAYYDGGWKYATSASAAILECNQVAGTMGYYSKASGTKDNSITWDTNFTVNTSGDGTFRGKFGCNGKTAQAAYALDSAVSGTVDDSYGAEEHAVLDALVSQINKLRAALVANGICS